MKLAEEKEAANKVFGDTFSNVRCDTESVKTKNQMLKDTIKIHVDKEDK